jgi:hypothetical protein
MTWQSVAVCFLIVMGILLAQPVMGQSAQERCEMCHRPIAQDPVAKHPSCLMCHRDYEAHMTAPRREKPAEVTIETCQTCHRPTEDFVASYHHSQNLDCQTCHAAHEQ